MYKLFVALRYLCRNWLTLVGIAAVFIGVLVMICVLSVMVGFDQELRGRLRATLSDIIIERWDDTPFGDYENLLARIERLPHVVACAPALEGPALARIDSQYGRNERYAQFRGIDLERELATTDLLDYWQAARGHAARDRIEQICRQGDYALRTLNKEELSALFVGLRDEDLTRLAKAQQAEIRQAAMRTGINLQDLLQQSVMASPSWGTVPDPDRETPVLAGRQLLAVAKTREEDIIFLQEGDTLILFVPIKQFTDRNIRKCRIAGAFHSGMYDYDVRTICLPLDQAQRYLGKAGTITSINVRLDSYDHAPLVRPKILDALAPDEIFTPDELEQGVALLEPLVEHDQRGEIAKLKADIAAFRRAGPPLSAESAEWDTQSAPISIHLFRKIHALAEPALSRAQGAADPAPEIERFQAFTELAIARSRNSIGQQFRVSTWEEKRHEWLRQLGVERRIIAVILFFVILIAGFLILSILHTTVITKTKDIGILKSIGGSTGGIMSIFLLNGLFIGLVGSALGTAVGLLITENINAIENVLHRLVGFRLFPSEIYYLDQLPVMEDPFGSITWICLVAIVISFGASVYPAWKASRMNPVEALRYE